MYQTPIDQLSFILEKKNFDRKLRKTYKNKSHFKQTFNYLDKNTTQLILLIIMSNPYWTLITNDVISDFTRKIKYQAFSHSYTRLIHRLWFKLQRKMLWYSNEFLSSTKKKWSKKHDHSIKIDDWTIISKKHHNFSHFFFLKISSICATHCSHYYCIKTIKVYLLTKKKLKKNKRERHVN